MKTTEAIKQLRKEIVKSYQSLGDLLNQVDIILKQTYTKEKEVKS